jgi:hypothetical protein
MDVSVDVGGRRDDQKAAGEHHAPTGPRGRHGLTATANISDAAWIAAAAATIQHAKSSTVDDSMSQKYLAALDKDIAYTQSTQAAIQRRWQRSNFSTKVPQTLSELRQATQAMRQRALSQVVAKNRRC